MGSASALRAPLPGPVRSRETRVPGTKGDPPSTQNPKPIPCQNMNGHGVPPILRLLNPFLQFCIRSELKGVRVSRFGTPPFDPIDPLWKGVRC